MVFETRERFNYLMFIHLAVENVHLLLTYTFSSRFRCLDSERVILENLSLYSCLLGAKGCKRALPRQRRVLRILGCKGVSFQGAEIWGHSVQKRIADMFMLILHVLITPMLFKNSRVEGGREVAVWRAGW
jgi:hypothetical protein